MYFTKKLTYYYNFFYGLILVDKHGQHPKMKYHTKPGLGFERLWVFLGQIWGQRVAVEWMITKSNWISSVWKGEKSYQRVVWWREGLEMKDGRRFLKVSKSVVEIDVQKRDGIFISPGFFCISAQKDFGGSTISGEIKGALKGKVEWSFGCNQLMATRMYPLAFGVIDSARQLDLVYTPFKP